MIISKKKVLFFVDRNLIYFLVFLGLVTWAIFAEYSQFSVIPAGAHKPIYSGKGTEQRVALAINIDWGEEYLPAMLKTLAAKNVKVTFFPTGTWISKNAGLLQQIIDQGHEIGNHGYSHKDSTRLNDHDLMNLIQDTGKLVKDKFDLELRLFAPPSGDVDERVVKIAASLGYETIMWTVDTIDWQRPSADTIINRVVPKIEPGSIILAHPTQPTSEALPRLIDMIQAKGYKFVSVGEIIK